MYYPLKTGSKPAPSADERFRFWTRLAAVVISVQAFIFLLMATAGFIYFAPKDSLRKADFSLVLLRLGFPHATSSRFSQIDIRSNWHFFKARHRSEEPLTSTAPVEFRFANYYQDNMVLQRGEPGAEVWGFGEPKQPVELEFNGLHLNTTVEDNGQWRVRLPVMEAGFPSVIQAVSPVAGTPVAIEIHSILFGDVWLCSGQSNMEFHVEWMFNASEELNDAASHKTIRFMEVQGFDSATPETEPFILQGWSTPDAVTLKEFSGVCWSFGRRLQEKLEIPIGLIGSYYGGTPIKAWSDSVVNAECKETQPAVSTSFHKYRGPEGDSVLWNGMIYPLLPLEIKGVIWYQGEADAGANYNGYLCMFPAMISSWRKHFRRPKLPFGFVQLGDHDGEDEGTPTVRWHQTADLGVVPNPVLEGVFMAVAMDLPDSASPYGSIHPRYKEEVAERLSAGAFSIVYNTPTPFQGPSPVSLTYEKNNLVIFYGSEPISFRGNTSSAFEVCCGKGGQTGNVTGWSDCPKWSPVKVMKSSSSTLTFDVSVCQKKGLQFVRYAWRTTPCSYLQCAVYGADTALPAGPFVLPVEGNSA